RASRQGSAIPLNGTVRGYRIISRPQRRPARFSAIATSVATEPQYVFGAATPGGHLHTEIKSEHVTDCRLRQALESGKKAKKPLLGGVCLWTKGVLIRVRPGSAPVPRLPDPRLATPARHHTRAPAQPGASAPSVALQPLMERYEVEALASWT